MSSFDETTEWSEANGQRTASFSRDWAQGQAIFGGAVTAAGLRRARALVPDDGRYVRTVTTLFAGPCEIGTVTESSRLIRSGRSVSLAESRISQGGTERAVVTGVFARDRESVVHVEPKPRQYRPSSPPEERRKLPQIPGVTPKFLQFFDLRWVEGSPPFSGSNDNRIAGWCRHLTAATSGPEAVLALLDAWPSPAISKLAEVAPASSISWTAHLLQLPERSIDGWYWFESEIVSADSGYATQLSRLFDPDGTLCAWSEQLVAVFG